MNVVDNSNSQHVVGFRCCDVVVSMLGTLMGTLLRTPMLFQGTLLHSWARSCTRDSVALPALLRL